MKVYREGCKLAMRRGTGGEGRSEGMGVWGV